MIKYIVAVRIYFDINNRSRADLLFNDGVVEYIDWKRNSQRNSQRKPRRNSGKQTTGENALSQC